MIITIRNRTVQLSLLAGFALTILLLTIRHYYVATTFTTLQASSQSTVQTVAVLTNIIELTLELSYPANDPLTGTTAQLIDKATHSVRHTVAIHPLLDSLVSLTAQRPELNQLARQLRAVAKKELPEGVRAVPSSGQVQQLVRSLQTLRLALADSLPQSQEQINGYIDTMRTLNNTVDSVLLILAATLLFLFYWYTLRRERLTKKVIDRQKELTQYLEAIPEGVIVLNTDSQIIYINQAAQQFLTITLTDATMTLADLAHRFRLSHPVTKEPILPTSLPLGRALRGEVVLSDNILLETQNGSRLLASHARPLYDREGELAGAISIFRDITEASRKEQELQEARTLAERSFQELEVFLANISHDIRTPLNAILGFAELLGQKQASANEHAYLEGIKLSGNNLLTLINELLDISQLESGQLVLEPVPTVLANVLKAVEADLSINTARKGLRYELQVDQAVPPVVLADPQRIIQILLNFCNHAIKFTQNGFVKLTVEVEETALPGQVNAVFCVEDSGVGIPEEALPHVFKRFSRVADDTLFRSAGTGLGLHIAHGLISLMNGTVTVRSQLNLGTTFTIRIPFTRISTLDGLTIDTSPFVATSPLSPFSASPSSVAVLIVEDNELNQKLLEGFLNRYLIKPVIVQNGQEAVTILEEQNFDLVLMDIQMPEMDGYTATQLIRERLRLAIPIVAMTAYTMPGERERCMAAGMTDYLSKPIRIEQLEALLIRFVPALQVNSAPLANVHSVISEEELINQAYLDEVTDGNNELLAELVSLFRRDLPQYRQALLAAAESGDHTTFVQTAHKFRSSLNALAMLRIAEQLKSLETDNQILNPESGQQVARLFQDIQRGITVLENKMNKT